MTLWLRFRHWLDHFVWEYLLGGNHGTCLQCNKQRDESRERLRKIPMPPMPPNPAVPARSWVIQRAPVMPLRNLNLFVEMGDGTIMQAQGKVSITILAGVTIDVSGVPVSGVIGKAYTGQVKGVGGVPPYTFSVDVLPQGLSLNASTGMITGTPTTAVTSEASTFTVNDSM